MTLKKRAPRGGANGLARDWEQERGAGRGAFSLVAARRLGYGNAMKLTCSPVVLLVAGSLCTGAFSHALADKEIDDAIRQATDAAKKLKVKLPDVKGILDEQEKQDAKEKAAIQAAVNAPGPAVLPAWTPKVPKFTASGKVVKKIVNDEAKIVQEGTSAATPEEVADAVEAAVADKKINHVRNNISSNGNLTTIMFLTTRTDPEEKVRIEARRAPGEKISRIVISSPLPVPETDDDK